MDVFTGPFDTLKPVATEVKLQNCHCLSENQGKDRATQIKVFLIMDGFYWDSTCINCWNFFEIHRNFVQMTEPEKIQTTFTFTH